ncbi:MAG: response regulator receiver protein [Pedosphaera sp.]|nr:response regulator receiver protein [Pedosphaera sp.]
MKSTHFTILIIDDSPTDQTLIVRAFRRNDVTNRIVCLDCGEEAIAYLNGVGQYADRTRFPYPTFIITDLKMPRGDGLSVLENLKKNPEWAVIPTVVLTASDDPDDIKKSYMLGASSYFVKSKGFDHLLRQTKILYDYWSESETPEVDVTGKRLKTESIGRLGERFAQGETEDATRAHNLSR